MFLIRFRRGELQWPGMCACCGEPPGMRLASRKALFRRSGRHQVPYCLACAGHVGAWEAGQQEANAIGVGGYVASVVLAAAIKSPIAGTLFLASLPVAYVTSLHAKQRARAACTPACVGGGPAVLDSRRGIRFLSEAFAVETARLNAGLLLAAPELVRAQLDIPRAVLLPSKAGTDGDSSKLR